MRTISLVPLTALVAAVAGCGPQGREQAAGSLPHRDLTLVAQTAEVKIASAVETQQLRIQQRTARQSRGAARVARAPRSSRHEPKVKVADVWAPALAPAAAEPVAQAASTAATPANDRELPPGKTVTVIPASSGPSTGSDQAEEFPPQRRIMVVRGGGGGTCRGRGRGPGIGISAAPRPDFR